MASAFLVLRNLEASGAGWLDAFYLTAPEATTKAATDAELTARAAAVDVGSGVRRGYWFDGTDAFTPGRPFTNTQRLRQAAGAAHAQLNAWAVALNLEGVGHDADHVALGHNYLFRGHQGVFLVVHSTLGVQGAGDPHPGEQTGYTLDEKIAFCGQVLFGSSDVTDPFSFFQLLEQGGAAAGLHDIPANPTTPVLWVDPVAGDRIALRDAIDQHNTEVSEGRLTALLPTHSIVDGAWIDQLMAT